MSQIAATVGKLQELVGLLRNKRTEGEQMVYRIPNLWNTQGVSVGYVREETNELFVNPYDFLADTIEKGVLKQDHSRAPITKHRQDWVGGDWIASRVIYGLQIRSFSAWDHDGSQQLEDVNEEGVKETGTFLKSIALLPLLKRMGVDAVYMLPISKYSSQYKKGELGSPYAVRNFFALDPHLKDPLLGEEWTVDDEFRAFVEACHRLDIRVIIDILPRTSARDSDLIADHPDWFYWIPIEELGDYAPPKVPEFEVAPLTAEQVPHVYAAPDVQRHLNKFRPSPDQIDLERWLALKQRCAEDASLDLFECIQSEFGLTTAPAFSDWINDEQPMWSDITFLRLYLDHPVVSAAHVKEEQPPYILFDVIKADRFPGAIRNEELWNVLADIIPHYQREYGIDGARIDMGHALPPELEAMILERARAIDPEFCFIAEVFPLELASKARTGGYNMILGDAWWREPRVAEGECKQLLQLLPELPLPILACAETPDTPRSIRRTGGETFVKLTTILNFFLPNGVPFISSGLELLEQQPMNTGLDCTAEERFVLPENDPFYGKLAFFDRYALHWNQLQTVDMPSILTEIAALRSAYLDLLLQPECCETLDFAESDAMLGVSYVRADANGGHGLIVVANGDLHAQQTIRLDFAAIQSRLSGTIDEAVLLFADEERVDEALNGLEQVAVMLSFQPGECKILCFSFNKIPY